MVCLFVSYYVHFFFFNLSFDLQRYIIVLKPAHQ